jgi:hypothetical protein
MKTNYNKQAKELLSSLGVKFSANFIEYGKHFSDDKECRDIFNITFSRNGKKFSLRFGQSLNDSTGAGTNKPTEYDVLSCIQKYDVGSFQDFCYEFGYDIDSRTAEKTYKAVLKEYDKVSCFFTDSEIEQLQEIQ